jgi:hypothetical protein
LELATFKSGDYQAALIESFRKIDDMINSAAGTE